MRSVGREKLVVYEHSETNVPFVFRVYDIILHEGSFSPHRMLPCGPFY